jgi:hypothetical protein
MPVKPITTYCKDPEKEAMSALIDRLYTTGPKPSLSGIELASGFILVHENATLQAFLAFYKNPRFPNQLIIGNFECSENTNLNCTRP